MTKLPFWKWNWAYGKMEWLVAIWFGMLVFTYLPLIWGVYDTLTTVIVWSLLVLISIIWIVGNYVYYRKAFPK